MCSVANGVGKEITEAEVKEQLMETLMKVPEVVAVDTFRRVYDWFENPEATWKDDYVLKQLSYLQRYLQHRLVDRRK